ncbi:MAG: protein translocase subunit SecDF [Planctomyces sp.]|nr:protein translocase subunit SecDF [Planctomyces sp.]
MSGWIIILWLVGIFVVPFILGNLIASALKMRSESRRFGIVLMVLAFGMAPFINQLIHGHSLKDAFRLGIDLAGGTNLVYQADKEQAEASGKEISSSAMDELTRSIARRVNPSGTEEVTVRQVGEDRVEIIIPGADTDYVQAMKDKITRLGSLEFGVLAARHDRAHQNIIARAEQSDSDDVFDGTQRVATWLPVARIQAGDNQGQLKDVTGDPSVDVFREREVNGQTIREFLVIVSPPEQKIDGRYLVNSRPTFDENGGVAVSFTFNARGGFLFQNLTGQYQPKKDGQKYRLAAILDGSIHSAPSINAVISESGIISGSFTSEEVNELVSVLNAGALEIPLVKEPVSEYTISPLLGVDVQEKGIMAISVAAIAVLIFMVVYYWTAGIIADICLAVNVALVLGAMALIDATFTLPGLAGLVLTIGMAVDANVLIFERMREELNRSSSLRMAIQNGFGKAFSTILDANLTTLISAIILYAIGTDQVRGFAVTLFIGIIMSMFSALYVGRLMFDVLENKRLISASSLLGKSIIGKTNLDFLGKQWLATILSLVVIAGGMTALVSRGNDNLDIDFTGGSMVTFQFTDNPGIEDARAALEEQFGNDMALERLIVPTDNGAGEDQIFFRLRSKNQDRDEVASMVNEAFEASEFHLTKNSVEFGEITAIPEQSEEENAEAAPVDLFAGGNQVNLTFADEETLTAIQDRVIRSYAKLTETPLDSISEALFALKGTAGSGMEADESAVQRYSEMELKVASEISQDQLQETLVSMQERMANTPDFSEVNTFSSAVAGETQSKALLAILASLAAIIAYIWFRFSQIAFGLAAVVALVHDVLVVLGLVAIASMLSATPLGPVLQLTDFKINLPMIAAFLTIIGYSLNDTIVVFDRIREVRGKNPDITKEIINTSVNQTLSRTILTSLTTLLVVLILYFIGGEGLHGFAFCLVAGIFVGTYSTIFIANPVLLYAAQRRKPDA